MGVDVSSNQNGPILKGQAVPEDLDCLTIKMERLQATTKIPHTTSRKSECVNYTAAKWDCVERFCITAKIIQTEAGTKYGVIIN
jgi:hypothetical protein